jgi:hypothetical protein
MAMLAMGMMNIVDIMMRPGIAVRRNPSVAYPAS